MKLTDKQNRLLRDHLWEHRVACPFCNRPDQKWTHPGASCSVKQDDGSEILSALPLTCGHCGAILWFNVEALSRPELLTLRNPQQGDQPTESKAEDDRPAPLPSPELDEVEALITGQPRKRGRPRKDHSPQTDGDVDLLDDSTNNGD